MYTWPYKVVAYDAPKDDVETACKIMNIYDGSVENVVNCDDFSGSIRDFGVVDENPTILWLHER